MTPLAPEQALRTVEAVASLTSMLRAAQLLFAWRNPWSSLLRADVPTLPRLFRLVHLAPMSESNDYFVLLTTAALTLLSGVVVLVTVCFGRNPLPALVLLVLCRILVHLRGRAALDASDQLSLICLLTCTAAEWIHTDLARGIALLFFAAQSALAYGTSGFLKLSQSSGWFDGSYPRYVLSTASFGNPRLHRMFTSRPWLASCAGFSVVLGECCLAFACLLPPPLCLVLLGFGLALHLGIARIMGLNAYLWGFVAMYPATYFVSVSLYHRGG